MINSLQNSYEKYEKLLLNHDYSVDIPEHWSVHRFRHIFSFGKGLTITKEDLQETGIPCLNYGEIHSKFGFSVSPEKDTLQCVDEQYIKSSPTSLIQHGDFVYADTSEDLDGSGNFSYLNSAHKIFAGYHTVIARLNEKQNERYIAYLLDSRSFREQIQRRVKGVKVYSITQAILKSVYLWLPTQLEQKKIVKFLDLNTSKLDKAIAIKKRQIELLKERKSIIIEAAVTEGLNPDIHKKNSNIDWIGEIPEHWDIKRAKYLLDEVNERSKKGDEELLSVSHLTGVTPRSEKNVSMFMAEDYSGSKLCRDGDLVINIMWAWMGALGVSDRTGIVSPSYGVFRQQRDNTFHPIYLEYLLKSTKYVEYYNKVSTGLHSSRLRFYGHMLMAMKLGFPPYEEQCEIIQFLDKECLKMDKAIDALEQQLLNLKEYRSSLINSAVTGKIKVPEVA